MYKNPKMPSNMKHQFSEVPKAEIPRSTFDRSHGFKTTFEAGLLIPVLADEALPGDTFNLKMAALARMNTPIFPLMDNLKLETFFFAVPIRLIWDNWEKFNGQQDNPDDSTDFIIPEMTSSSPSGYNFSTIHDYLGIPPGVPGLTHSCLWHRAYNLVYNEWFRDQNLQDSVIVNKDDGPDSPSDYTLLRRGKRHDYFTSALPWPQKGDSIDIPLGQAAPINVTSSTSIANPNVGVFSDGAGFNRILQNVGATTNVFNALGQPAPEELLYADLTEATAATINQLRQSFQIQKLLERDARGGTRYTEVIQSHFGVTSPDARLQRPEYLGGGSTDINFQPVASTVEIGVLPQGSLSSVATAAFNNHSFTKSFTEHCIIIGLANVRADLTYQQGLERQFSRSTRYDFFWPALSHIGEQEILNKEIYAQGTANPAQDESVFGYQERYAEYRYKPSRLSGLMRSDAPTSLDAWHAAQDFGSLPTLSSQFIEDIPPLDRVVAIPSEPDFKMDSYFKMTCTRPMPLYGIPGFVDRF